MNNVTAYGKFEQHKGEIYRTSTYLQWGKSEDIIGACVMCNPGSADNKKTSKDNFNSEVQKLELDITMKGLVEIIQKIHEGQSIEGRLYIYNLFTLRNPNMDNALNRLNEMYEDSILYQDYEDFNKNIHNIPWILLAWGCGKGEKIIQQRKRWLNYLKKCEKPIIGKQGNEKRLDPYWHPYQHGSKRQQELKNYLVKEYKEKILNSTYLQV